MKLFAARFLMGWVCIVGTVIAACATGYYSLECRAQWERLRQDTLTLAAVVAPRVLHDVQNHAAGYAHKTLRAIQATEKDAALSLYSASGAMLFSTHPGFRRAKEPPAEVSQVIASRKARWACVPGEDRCQVFFPLLGRGAVTGVLQITRNTHDLLLIPLFKTGLLVVFCWLVAALASGFLLLLMRRHHFKPLKELNSVLQSLNKPISAAIPPVIPEGEFHGELTVLYRHTRELARNLAEARKSLENRAEVRSAVDKVQEEACFLARQVYDQKIDRLDSFAGYEIISKPVQMEKWGRLWKNAVSQGGRKVVFSFWNNKNDGLKAVLQGLQWDEIFSGLVQRGKNLDEISEELFMEFGLDMGEWLLGQWDAHDRRLEMLGNVWACQWNHDKETFSFLKNATPMTGTRKQGFWAKGPFGPGDKLLLCNADAFEAPGGAGLEAFLGLLSKNIKSTPQNLLDLLVGEITEGRLLAPDASLLFVIHAATLSGFTGKALPVDRPAEVALPQGS